MALVFIDGFDHYSQADILKKWTGLTGSAVGTTATLDIRPEFARPPGGMGLFLAQGAVYRGVFKTFAATHTSFVAGFNVFFLNVATVSPFIAFYDSSSGAPAGTCQVGLRMDGTGHLQVVTGATTVLTTSTNTLSASTWYHIEVSMTINNSTGSYEVKVNGSSVGWIPATASKNTRGQSANNYIDIAALVYVSVGAYFDDFYFLSSSAPNNTFVGPQKVLAAFPSGVGNYAQWTGNYAANYANVNELAGDGDQTFNQSATVAQVDSFIFDDMPAGTITAVQFAMEARQDAGAARTVAMIERAAAGPTDNALTSFILAGSYLYYLDPHDVDPDTTSAWTVALFNSNEYGVKLIS